MPRLTWRGRVKLAGFTRIDLLVVLVVLTMLVAMLLPALARTKTDSRAFQCLNNLQQLTRALRMWADDNNDTLLANAESLEPATVWITGTLDNNPSNLSNWNPDTDIKKSPLWFYCGTNVAIWRCPMDPSFVVVNGVRLPRIRSYAMNLYAGTPMTSPLNAYRSYRKFSEITDPSPAYLSMFYDHRADSFDIGSFAINMTGYSPRNSAQYSFYDLPGAYHDGGVTLTHADGRAEIHRWIDPRTTPPLVLNGQITDIFASPRNLDIAWLQERTTRPK